MIETIYLIGVPVAFIAITAIKALQFGFVTVGGLVENVILAVMWPLTVFAFAVGAVLTCDFCLWGER